jgi:hypothetical protein
VAPSTWLGYTALGLVVAGGTVTWLSHMNDRETTLMRALFGPPKWRHIKRGLPLAVAGALSGLGALLALAFGA